MPRDAYEYITRRWRNKSEVPNNLCREVYSRMIDEKRLRLIANIAYGEILDIGFKDLPNPYLNNPVGIDLCETKCPPNYKEVFKGDCSSLNKYFKEHEFDTVIAGEVIEHLENASAFLRSVYYVLKDDGQLILTTPNPYNFTTMIGNILFIKGGLTPDHINLYPYRAMLALLQHCGFRVRKVLNGSSGTRLWHTNRKFFIPMYKGFCWQLMYICEKSVKNTQKN